MRSHRVQGIAFSSWLIEGEEGLFLVDGGFRWFHPLVLAKVRTLGRRLEDLRLVVLTHPHLDHVGAIPALADRADFEIAAHPHAADALASGGRDYSPPTQRWTRAVEWLATTAMPLLNLPPLNPTVPAEDGMRLDGFGLASTLYYTPGHSPWCISLVLDDGTAFAGDLIIGVGHMTSRVSPPAMAFDVDLAVNSMRKLLEAGAKRFKPAHGREFSADEVAETIARHEGATSLGG